MVEKETITSNKEKIFKKQGYIPEYITYPMEDAEKVENITEICEPSKEDIKECKDWVDFKEM